MRNSIALAILVMLVCGIERTISLPINYISLGKRIAAHRTNAGLSQERLADLLHVNRNHISRIERGRSYPSLDLLVDIALILEVTIDELLEEDMKHLNAKTDELYQMLQGCSPLGKTLILRNAASLLALLKELGIQ